MAGERLRAVQVRRCAYLLCHIAHCRPLTIQLLVSVVKTVHGITFKLTAGRFFLFGSNPVPYGRGSLRVIRITLQREMTSTSGKGPISGET